MLSHSRRMESNGSIVGKKIEPRLLIEGPALVRQIDSLKKRKPYDYPKNRIIRDFAVTKPPGERPERKQPPCHEGKEKGHQLHVKPLGKGAGHRHRQHMEENQYPHEQPVPFFGPGHAKDCEKDKLGQYTVQKVIEYKMDALQGP